MSSIGHPKKRKINSISRESIVSVVNFQHGRKKKSHHVLSERQLAYGEGQNHKLPPVVPVIEESDAVPAFEVVEEEPSTTRRKTKNQDDILKEWKEKDQEYMEVLLDFESIGKGCTCSACGKVEGPLFRCLTCLGKVNYCQSCIVSLHRGMPFHRTMRWDHNAGCFLAETLGSLGLVLSLGHESHGSICPCPGNVYNLTVAHVNGLHNISVRFCDCSDSMSPDLQLFGYRLFPSTICAPQTAFSFEVLEQFRFQHLEGKTSVYTYMNSLLRLTDNANQFKVEDRTREFRRVFRQWSYLRAGQFAGRYEASDKDAPLVVPCPACPHPGKNIPEKWSQLIPANDHWLHRQFIHFDANFRLTLEKRSNRCESSIALWASPGYFVNSEKYQEYLTSAAAPRQEASECVDHKALVQAPRRRFESLEVSGIAGAVCRHECAIPQSFVNLSHGERYVNSDYGISTAMKSMDDLLEIVLTYDIGCQYSRNFKNRFESSPYLELPNSSVIFAVPKFHLPAHKEDCRYVYSLNYLKHVGRTDGEAIERFWSTHNRLSGSTSRMSPEHRLDTLNAHFADWNWRKLCNMGKTLLLRLKDSQAQVVLHSAKYTDIHTSLDEGDAQRWIRLDNDHEPTHGKRTIYQLAVDNAPSQMAILHELSQTHVPANARQDHISTNMPTVAIWINNGLELEDAQRSLRVQASTVNTGSTLRDWNLLNEKRNALYNRLMTWRRTSPFGEDDVGDSDSDEDENDIPFEDMLIPLPSNLPNIRLALLPQLSQIEQRLRSGQAHDALKQLRRGLALRTAIKRGSQNARGQNENLRSNASLKRVDSDINLMAARYKAAYSALSRMNSLASYPDLKELKQSDLTASNVFAHSRPLGRGYETASVSWIWIMQGIDNEMKDDNWLQEVLRVQFLDVKTTLDRWKEEEQLVQVEIKRTADYFKWMTGVWFHRAKQGQTAGSRAHATSMKLIYSKLEEDIRSSNVL